MATIGNLNYSVTMLANGMNENDPKRAYASLQLDGNITTAQIAEHIAEHGSVYTKGTVIGVLTELAVCIRHFILDGYSITLDDIGIIYPSIKSKGAESPEKFTTDNIISLTAKFRSRGELADLRSAARFSRVATRKAQAATLEAQNSGQTSADWSDDDDDDNDNDGE